MTDTKMIVLSVVGTGIVMTTVIVGFVGIIAGGSNNRFNDVNDRIDDLTGSVNSRFSDVHGRIDDVSTSFNSRIDDLTANVNSRFDDMNRRIDGLQNDLRELRALLINTLKVDEPAED